MKDLFETPELLPIKVQQILLEQGDCTYEDCENMLKRLERLGYTFEYYLDAVPFNLREVFKKGQVYGDIEIKAVYPKGHKYANDSSNFYLINSPDTGEDVISEEQLLELISEPTIDSVINGVFTNPKKHN